MEATWRTRAMLIVALMELTTFHGGRDHGAGPHLHHWQTRLLQPLTIPYPHNLGPNLVLQDDDARPHRASVITDYLQKVGVECCKDIQKFSLFSQPWFLSCVPRVMVHTGFQPVQGQVCSHIAEGKLRRWVLSFNK